MGEPAKRTYTSRLRTEQAKQTRRQIVEVAAVLFAEQGYGATTIDAVAAAAGVSRKTVFTSVGGKVELMKLAYDFAITGDDEPVPLRERAAIRTLAAEPDPARMLTGFAALITEINTRITGIYMAMEAAAQIDHQIKDLYEALLQQRLTAMRNPATQLAEADALHPDLTIDTAADLLWLHNDPALFDKLVRRRNWPPARYQAWLASALCNQLLRHPR